MKEATKPAAEVPTDEATGKEPMVKINREGYTSSTSASGKKSLHNGDPVAVAFAGLDVPTLYGVVSKFMGVDRAELEERYQHLNIGMQRMNLGNRARGQCAKLDGADGANDGDGAKALQKLCPAVEKKADKAA